MTTIDWCDLPCDRARSSGVLARQRASRRPDFPRRRVPPLALAGPALRARDLPMERACRYQDFCLSVDFCPLRLRFNSLSERCSAYATRTVLSGMKPIIPVLLLFMACTSSPRTAIEPSTAHDVIIRGGTVYDGTGSPGRIADVAIDGQRITAVGYLKTQKAKSEV